MGAAGRAYGLGLALAALVAVAGQVLLGLLPAGQGSEAAVREVGYTLTGLFALAAWTQARRGRGLPERARALAPELRPGLMRREYLRAALVCSTAALAGLIYWGLGGRSVERHARTFLALGPAAYLALAVRPGRWPEGSGAAP